MTVQIHDTKQLLRVDPPAVELKIEDAVQLARDLIDAVTQCGFEVKMDVEVPRHVPTEAQITHAVARVSHIRKSYTDRPWNDERVNRELVMRVLEACL